ncbi:unnamed protein product [Dracunculus medinensis]|uniref:Sugar phosphate phosphatase n=1 Tax=Dracunculus medinensis TaxID=318479 RepID=A0A158Q6L8_DRAME|nr:unnamed protein product [Dracunculus medinensis]
MRFIANFVWDNSATFVYNTIHERWPIILTKVIDQVHRYRQIHVAVYREEGYRDMENVIAELTELHDSMTCDKPLVDFNDDLDNVELWNNLLYKLRKENKGELSWYRLSWLFIECYVYRRIAVAFRRTKTLSQFDPFAAQKQIAFIDSINSADVVANYLDNFYVQTHSHTLDSKLISRFLQICLWGNKCDLSLSCGDSMVPDSTLLEMGKKFTEKIISNDLQKAIEILQHACGQRIDIVLDNAGLELFGDLVLADFLINVVKVGKVIFRGKAMPWFVSDVTNGDFHWLLEILSGSNHNSFNKAGQRWQQMLAKDKFEFQAHRFWTLPFPYCEMQDQAPDLYDDLAESAMIIFKGDLNYRKLVGDRKWPWNTPFKVALRGFTPAPVLALRTIKSETVVGLSDSVIADIENLYGESEEWMITGEYAVVQLQQ